MKHQISTKIKINAPKEKVWNILTAFDRYPTWDLFIKSITGNIAVGEKFHVHIDTMNFKPTVLVYNEFQEFTWLGHFIFSGIFDGKHSFLLTENNDKSTTLEQSEEFSGILVRFMKNKLNNEVLAKFKLMNEKLKEIIEEEIKAS